jgi:hypothetical protein
MRRKSLGSPSVWIAVCVGHARVMKLIDVGLQCRTELTARRVAIANV